MGKYSYNFNENDYKTPPELYQAALTALDIEKFTLDACCSDEHIPALNYYKNGVNDGLKGPWMQFTWCNPPFNECKKWIEKAVFECKNFKNTIVMLLPVRTETAYWHEYILKPAPFYDCHIDFLRKGHKFLNKDNEEMGIFKNALALVYFYPRLS